MAAGNEQIEDLVKQREDDRLRMETLEKGMAEKDSALENDRLRMETLEKGMAEVLKRLGRSRDEA